MSIPVSVEDEHVVVEYRGSIIRVQKVNGLYKCPYCDSLFFSERDLFRHILAHATRTLTARREPSSRWH